MRFAKKLNQKYPGLAWIPGAGPLIVSYKASKSSARPWHILLIGAVAMVIGLILLAEGTVSTVSLVIGIIFLVAAIILLIYFSVYTYIWSWKLFDAVGRPGWWALIPLFSIPFAVLALIPALMVGFTIINYGVTIWYLVMIGIAAWGTADVLKKSQGAVPRVEVSSQSDVTEKKAAPKTLAKRPSKKVVRKKK